MSRKKGKYGQVASCPACDSRVRLNRRPHRGQTVYCNSCHSLLEIVHLSPLILEWAFEEPFDMPLRNGLDDVDEWDYSDFDDYDEADQYGDYPDEDDSYEGAYKNGRRL